MQSLFRLQHVAGFGLPAWRAARPEQARAEMRELAGHAAAGRRCTVVHATFPRTEAAKAHQVLDDRAQLGRVLIVSLTHTFGGAAPTAGQPAGEQEPQGLR